jgi:transcriptional regulator with XRE-family HTH domain
VYQNTRGDGSLSVMTPDEQDLTTKIGLRLRSVRKSQKLSLAALSDRTDGMLSKSRISNYEQGIRRPGIEEARILAKALGTVSAVYLLCLDDEGFISEDERELLRCYRETDERGRRTILGVAESQRVTEPK